MEFLVKFARDGWPLPTAVASAVVVSICFGVTFAVSISDEKFKRKSKAFFLYVSAFCEAVTIGACSLGSSLGDLGRAEAAFVSVSSALGFLVLFGILWIQSKFGKERQAAATYAQQTVTAHTNRVRQTADIYKDIVGDKEKIMSPEQAPAHATARRRVAEICEIPIRPAEHVRMESAHGEVLGEKYLKDCISRLKSKELSDEHRAELGKIERALFPLAYSGAGEKRNISLNCGKLISLLSQYV